MCHSADTSHPDHIGCIGAIKEVAHRCKVYVSAREKAWLEDIDIQYQQRPIPSFQASTVPDDSILPGLPVEVSEMAKFLDTSDYVVPTKCVTEYTFSKSERK